jgi:hypothetical protein
MDATLALLFVALAVVMGWFAFGVVWNIRRGNAVLKWMQAGLPRLGERTTLRWMGSSAVELAIAKARHPFRRVELILVLEPRDVPWFWLLSRAQGRRDMLIVRGQLSTAPQFEYDLLSPHSWSEREAAGRGAARSWESEPFRETLFRAPAATRPLSRQLAPAALETARSVNPVVWRLSSRRESPQLELHVPLPDPRRADASTYFDALRALAEQLSRKTSPPAL